MDHDFAVYHVLPLNDLREHNEVTIEIDFGLHSPCDCNPRLEDQPNGSWLVIHNSFDGREGVEWVNEILKN